MSNLLELLDIDEAAAMLHCSAAKVRQMVIGDRTLAAVHEDYRGFRDTFELRGLRLFDVNDLGAITDVRTNKPAGFLRFTFAEVVRVLAERAHLEANAVPLSELLPPALGESEPSALALGDEKQSVEAIHHEVLASRTQLIDAFSCYGVELKIFKALKDRPGLKAARRVTGNGQKGRRAEPLFCPLEVVNWLVKDGVKGKLRLGTFMGWNILQTKFPDFYAEKSMCDPR